MGTVIKLEIPTRPKGKVEHRDQVPDREAQILLFSGIRYSKEDPRLRRKAAIKRD